MPEGLTGDGGYPPFPKDVKREWDGIQDGRYDPISKYWGSTSKEYWNWSVAALFPHDNRSLLEIEGGGLQRADYQSMFPKLTLIPEVS